LGSRKGGKLVEVKREEEEKRRRARYIGERHGYEVFLWRRDITRYVDL
jgi:hypothetical protein